MLYTIEGSKIETIPHRADHDRLESRLTTDQYSAIIEAIHKAMNCVKIFNASFLPGADWTGTPFMAIYEACGEDQEQAGMMYGLLCWVAVQRHPDEWVGYPSTGKDEQAQKSLGRGWTYFRK
jgi:hypothetical protein